MPSLLDENTVQILEDELNIIFDNKLLLQKALIHKSFSNENKSINSENNERLEFLGDAVLNLAVTTYLFQNYMNYSEGELAKIKSVVVSEEILNKKANKINLGEYILMGKGEELTGGRNRKSILADTLEAVFGAIYLDKNFNFICKYIQDFLKNDIKEIAENEHIGDYKTILQEVVQQDNKRPQYEVIQEKGPEHNKTFLVKVDVDDKTLGKGKGNSKKDAEQEAAKTALENLNEI